MNITLSLGSVSVRFHLVLPPSSPLCDKGKKDGKGKERRDRKSLKKKKNAIKSFKFDSDSSSEDDSNDGLGKSTMDKETRFIGELTSTYGNCALCKPKICKIGQGIHVSLTFNMRAAWAAALAREEAGVTLSTPPKTEQFRQFHHSIELPTLVSNLSNPTTPSFGSNMSVMKEFVAPITVAQKIVHMFAILQRIINSGWNTGRIIKLLVSVTKPSIFPSWNALF
ncbi:hypothetical protein DFJ43DRAFT_1159385 [Lentinula guzmanii]|uniref:Uncharacterized protein n=1 Tax=Lentinula guzmanii TaxID=2804957 RepID=A0AA38MVY2_9AGAR|nr:hypothetical protein DFJ43DRAFT_1159385 [Lentinula guzmanii]